MNVLLHHHKHRHTPAHSNAEHSHPALGITSHVCKHSPTTSFSMTTAAHSDASSPDSW
jgi:hypothetical protein